MTFVVPFDGSELAETALARAGAFAARFETPVVAVTVIPQGNADYAVERGWLEPGAEYDADRIVATLQEQVGAACPGAPFATSSSIATRRWARSRTGFGRSFARRTRRWCSSAARTRAAW